MPSKPDHPTTPRILHHQLDPASRLVRLMFAEYSVPLELVEMKPWAREPKFLELNPAATVPVLLDPGLPPVIGVLAALHAVEERYAPSVIAGLMPPQPAERQPAYERDRRLKPSAPLQPLDPSPICPFSN